MYSLSVQSNKLNKASKMYSILISINGTQFLIHYINQYFIEFHPLQYYKKENDKKYNKQNQKVKKVISI